MGSSLVGQCFCESIALEETVRATYASSIAAMAVALVDCLRQGSKVLLCGNGGSAGDAQHLAAELVNRFLKERPAIDWLVDVCPQTCYNSIDQLVNQ